jgi:uncharacterized membrane protein
MGASNALNMLKQAKKERMIGIDDAAVLVKDSQGKIKISETADMTGTRGAAIGAVAGGVLGLLAGPIGWLAVGGGVLGGLAAKMSDGGFPQERLRQIGEGLQPNTSALIAVIEHRWVDEVRKELEREAANIITESVRDEIANSLKQEEETTTLTVSESGEEVTAEAKAA